MRTLLLHAQNSKKGFCTWYAFDVEIYNKPDQIEYYWPLSHIPLAADIVIDSHTRQLLVFKSDPQYVGRILGENHLNQISKKAYYLNSVEVAKVLAVELNSTTLNTKSSDEVDDLKYKLSNCGLPSHSEHDNAV